MKHVIGFIIGVFFVCLLFVISPSKETHNLKLPYVIKPDTVYYYEIKVGDVWKTNKDWSEQGYVQITKVTKDSAYYRWKFSFGLGGSNMKDDKDSFSMRYDFFRPAYIRKVKTVENKNTAYDARKKMKI